jgi:predicted CoA-binding protein
MATTPLSRDDLLRIYRDTGTIAVVGASNDPTKAAHVIPAYLQSQGYRILPVNPRGGEILGEPVATSLTDLPVPVDVIDVFRPAAEAAAIATDAVAVGPAVLWFQPGTDTDEAVAIATAAGITVVTGRCMGRTHGDLGLGPGPGPHS